MANVIRHFCKTIILTETHPRPNAGGELYRCVYRTDLYHQSAKGGNAILDSGIIEEADRGRWFYDLMAYGAWRKRVVSVGNPSEPQLCPGKFGIAGLQFSPMRSLNRWVAIGPSLDVQWDESAGLSPYWVEGTSGDMIKFRRPPIGKQIGVGLSAHAELTMPIFSVMSESDMT